MAANVFLTLTAPAGNGHGAAVDVSSIGSIKTLVVGSSGGRYEPVTTIEASNDQVSWAPVATFQGKSEKTITVACGWMRQSVSSFVDGSVPVAAVGGDNSGATLTTLAVTAGSGTGAASSTSSLNTFKSIQVGGAFKGVVNVEISEDGGESYSTVASFSAPGIANGEFSADHMRVTRAGVPAVDGGQPTVIVADSATGGGGGSGGTITVKQNGSLITSGATGIDFVGAGVSGGIESGTIVMIDIEALTVSKDGVVIGNLGGTVQLDFSGAGVTLTDLGNGEVRATIAGGGGGMTFMSGTLNPPVDGVPATVGTFYFNADFGVGFGLMWVKVDVGDTAWMSVVVDTQSKVLIPGKTYPQGVISGSNPGGGFQFDAFVNGYNGTTSPANGAVSGTIAGSDIAADAHGANLVTGLCSSLWFNADVAGLTVNNLPSNFAGRLAGTNPVVGPTCRLYNIGAGTVTLVHNNSVNGTAFFFVGGANLVIPSGGFVMLENRGEVPAGGPAPHWGLFSKNF